ncbi:NAD(P)H-binding protein [Flagellimonas flava]|uniref:Nucleoside-diphosphate-sugar epimerase n=1 Tax=Flagellimonas flava TaxID=570519 RepID=A0A1M5M8E7_9FLAO|nr:NAD(P)H-binding protein [Allomuricauda flava]SHG73501.1 Nucleoside-diphosphate-sugar epimerase [Allomuricauda flava]
MNRNIGVLGCGWLGLPLAKTLVEQSYFVKGTTTSLEKLPILEAEGITPFQISFSPVAIVGDISGFLADLDILIVNIPPRLRSGNQESYIDKMKLLYGAIKKSTISKVVFVSSTSVYGSVLGLVSEETVTNPTTASGIQLLQSEKLFSSDDDLETAIVRFGGLIGPKRHPATMLSGRKNLTNGDDPINLIHLDDCIHLISTIIRYGYWGEIFNGVFPSHPIKRDYYTKEAIKLGIKPPDYVDKKEQKRGKVIQSRSFLNKGHAFHTPIDS